MGTVPDPYRVSLMIFSCYHITGTRGDPHVCSGKRVSTGKSRLSARFLLCLILCTVLLAVPGSAATLTVATDGSGEYTTISSALSAASAGDTIYIRNGSYTETSSLIISKPNIAIRGENVDKVYLNIPTQSIEIEVSASGCSIENITFQQYSNYIDIYAQNTVIRNNRFYKPRYGIYVYNSSNLISNNVLLNVSEYNAYGIFCSDTAEYNIFQNNGIYGTTQGHQLYLKCNSSIVENNTLLDGTQQGIYVYKSSNNTIVNNSILNNSVGIRFYKSGADNLVYLNTINGNTNSITSSSSSTPSWNSTSLLAYDYTVNMAAVPQTPAYLGNWWGSSYTGTDDDGNGIADSGFTPLDSFGTDTAPLMGIWQNGTIYGGQDTIAPGAGFMADNVTGQSPVTIQFTSWMIGPGTISSYAWDFGDGGTSSDQNPSYTYTSGGTYTVNLTVTGPGGSTKVVKSGLITVTVEGADLYVSSISPITAVTANTINATIKNGGTIDAGSFKADFNLNGTTTEFTIDGLAAGSSTNISVTDPITSRKYGDLVPITVTLDTEDAVPETDETNNTYSVNAMVGANGIYYFGGRYYYGYDLETRNYTEGHVAVIYSMGNSGYQSEGHWSSTTVQYTSTNLPIPENATVKAARLYQSYTFDDYGNPGFTLQFNGNTVEQEAFYGDGTDNYNGQAIYDVTPYFNPNGNTAIITAAKPDGGLYGAVLVVIYEDFSEPYRKIWLDEGCDSLYIPAWANYSEDLYNGFAMFRDVSNASVGSAKLTTILPSGADNSQSTILFNNRSVSIVGSGGSDPGYKYYDVTGALQTGTNELGIINDGYMNLAAAFLEVSLESPPETSFSATPVSGTAPLTVRFADASYGATTWQWDFGDGDSTNATVQNPVHTYTSAGTYTVSLTANNTFGSDTETKTGYITVTPPPPTANFTASVTGGSLPLTVQFTDTSLNGPTSWNWSFGDGNVSTSQNPSHTYESVGAYSVNLTAGNTYGSTSYNRTNLITVTDPASTPPSVSFTIAATSGQAPFTVQFTDTSTGSPYLWIWDFGDGGTSSDQNATHTYLAAGTYSVNLTATGPGGIASKRQSNAVTVTAAPISDNYFGSIPLATVKTGSVSGDLWWHATSTMQKTDVQTFTLPDHTGITWARLYVVVYDGHMQNNYRGTATISVDADGDSSYELVRSETFNTTYTYPGAGGTGRIWINDHMNRVTSDYFMWYDLTDAISGNTVNVQVATSAIDTSFDGRVKMIGLVVAYDDGDQDRVYYWVNQGHDTVNGNDEAYYSYSGSTGFGTSSAPTNWGSANLTTIYLASANGRYTFQGSSLANGTPTTSYFGTDTWPVSGLLPARQDSTMTYTHDSENAYYKIPLALLSVRYPAGGGPVAEFSATPMNGTEPLNVGFTDASTGSPTSWSWDFGDGNTSASQNPLHTYISSGSYDVTLTVTDAGSHTSTIVKNGYITVNSKVPPVALFNAVGINGTAPLTVRFTDYSENTPTAWHWDFGDYDVTNATLQNPVHTYAAAGTYNVTLTVTNAAGSDSLTKSGWITVHPATGGNYDLTITGSVAPRTQYVFARENNTVQITGVKNAGTTASPAAQLQLKSSDGFVSRVTVPALPAGNSTTITINDTTIRQTAGGTVSYTATIDPDNVLTETSETNNAASSSSYTVLYNGYKGKTYWADGNNITTYRSFDLQGGLVYSFGDSEYRSGDGSWTSYPVTWSAGDLPVPAGSTVKEARLYVPYTWDNSNQAPGKVHIDFNGNRIPYENWYSDKSNFGYYSNYAYGLLTYDVTDGFSANAPNTAAFTRDTPNSKISMNGFLLAVVYENPASARKQIFLNEEYDLLSAYESGYGTSPEEATAYVLFTGRTIDTTDVAAANLTTFVPFGDSGEGNLLFNGNTVGTYVWNYGPRAVGASDSPQVGVNISDVKTVLLATGNRAGIQSTPGTQGAPTMAAAQQFLVVEYATSSAPTTPDAAFTANVTSGVAPFTVKFKDVSDGPDLTRTWDFNGDTVTDSTDRAPVYTYTTPGTYTVNLTVTNGYGTSTATKTVTAVLGPPVVAFTANATAGTTPLTVQFNDTSTRLPTGWSWDFGDNSTASTVQNPVHTYAYAGRYTVQLTATNAAGSGTATQAGYINVTAYKKQESTFALTGVQANGTGTSQTITINTTQANATTNGSVVNVTCCGSNWSYLQIRMNGTPTNSTTEISGTVDTVTAATEPVTVPIESVGTPTVQIVLALDEMPNATASISETITQDPDSLSSFSAAASSNGKQIDAVAYTLTVAKTDLANADDGGIILNATITMAVNISWVNAHGGTGSIVIMRRTDSGTTRFLTTTLSGTDSSGNYVFTAVSPGLSTFILSSVSTVSSGGDSGGSSSGSGGGGSGTTAKSFVGAVYDFLASPLAAIASDSTTTYVSEQGPAESGWILAPSLTAMPDAKTSWTADITSAPDGGGKISTAIIPSLPDDTLAKFRSALASQNLALDSVAYAMEIVKTNIPGTSNAVITMTASPDWVANTSGVEYVRILRLSDDDAAQVLTTSFTEYDMDTGYLTFQAQSPDGLCTFALVSVKPGAGYSAGTSQPDAIPTKDVRNSSATATSQEFPVLFAIIAVLILAIAAEAVAILYTRRKNAERKDESEDDEDDYDEEA